ncbi:hypothetical protein LTR84_004520 [Exophiala bonariae]|uniref:Carboxyphosphonoenolpyruvate phosphonomutase-like protein n=1 Tax=Exophiala bonariae TaxID=1690606 RepID=A0AAV9NQP8_9EURO|nr:hypothetical protein LTR84_004520 [Exophiala bonariae]
MGYKGLNDLAKSFGYLHRPGEPLILANVYDLLSARAVAPLPSCNAIATASYSVAMAAGTDDDHLSLQQNIAAARLIGNVAAEYNKPFTVDLQDGYGTKLEDAIRQVIEAGAVGINLEDCDKESKTLYAPDEAAARVSRALSAASKAGVPDFVVNARCDTLVMGGKLEEAIERGKKYLEAGATTVFVWGGGKRGVSRDEVEEMVKAFDGRLNVSLKWDKQGLSVRQLAELGVARISVGPTIMFFATAEYQKRARELLEQLK